MFFNEVYFGAQLTVLNSDKLCVCQVFKFLTSDTAHSLCDVHVNLKQCDLLVTVDGFRYVSISRSTGQGDHRPVRHVHPCLCCLRGTQSENTYRWLLTCWSRNSGRHNYNRSKLKKVGKYLPFFLLPPAVDWYEGSCFLLLLLLTSLVSSFPIGQFSKAGLLEWMRFVIFCARRERSQRTPGRFRRRCCFMLGITVEVVRRIVNTVAVAKITVERGCRVEKKVSLHCFLADQKIASS